MSLVVISLLLLILSNLIVRIGMAILRNMIRIFKIFFWVTAILLIAGGFADHNLVLDILTFIFGFLRAAYTKKWSLALVANAPQVPYKLASVVRK